MFEYASKFQNRGCVVFWDSKSKCTKRIGTLVFWGTESIKSITIPASVTEITDLFYFVKNCNPDVEIHTPKGSKAEEVANSLGLKVVND